MKKNIVLALGIITVIVGVFFFLRSREVNVVVNNFQECVEAGYPVAESYPPQCRTPDGKTFTQEIGNELEKQDLIRITKPRPNTTVSSPLTISGQARGYWFFEASFPVKLVDANGKELGQGIAQAQGEWMTEDFVPFTAEIVFDTPDTSTGSLILEKDNPSGLPENADQLIVPIEFSNN